MKILIADDNPLIRRMIRALLEAQGWYVCAEAENGAEAVTLATDCKPEVVVLDFAMPEMNGAEAAREIVKTLPDVPIFLFTLYPYPLVEKEATRAGIQRVISKSALGRTTVSEC
jgi:CheY-like chemotaxis protein